MHELIKYIGDILNIKTDSVYTIQDMTEELSKIKDLGAYRSFIKDNLNSITVDYKTGFQKFILLTQEYLALEYLAINPDKERMAISTANTAFRIITNGKYNGLSNIKDGGYEPEEKKLLSSIGSPMYIQELLDNDTLKSAIVKKIMDNESALPYQQLPARMSQMLNGTAKAIR